MWIRESQLEIVNKRISTRECEWENVRITSGCLVYYCKQLECRLYNSNVLFYWCDYDLITHSPKRKHVNAALFAIVVVATACLTDKWTVCAMNTSRYEQQFTIRTARMPYCRCQHKLIFRLRTHAQIFPAMNGILLRIFCLIHRKKRLLFAKFVILCFHWDLWPLWHNAFVLFFVSHCCAIGFLFAVPVFCL